MIFKIGDVLGYNNGYHAIITDINNDDIDLELGSRRKHLYGEVELGDVSDHNNAKHSSSYIGSNNSDDVKQRIRVSKNDNKSLRNISEDCNLGCEDSQTTSGSKLSLKIV